MSGHHVLLQFLYKEDIFRQRICERSVVCLILHKPQASDEDPPSCPASEARRSKGNEEACSAVPPSDLPDERCTVWKKDSDAVRSAHHQA